MVPPALSVRDRARPYETFERWGIRTLGALAALPAADLLSRLGRRGQALHRLARGSICVRSCPIGRRRAFSSGWSSNGRSTGSSRCRSSWRGCSIPLSLALERADRGAAAVHLDVAADRSLGPRRRCAVAGRLRDARVLRTLMLLDLESHPPSRQSTSSASNWIPRRRESRSSRCSSGRCRRPRRSRR